MTMAPVRPIFQNGQRLTAERLTQALEFLRTMIRRMLLAPLSAGVAEGFELTPIFGEQSPTLTVAPGLGIDGRGRLLVVPEAHTFTIPEIINAVGSPSANPTPTNPLIVRVCLALDDSGADNDPCSPYRPLSIEEDFRFIFQVEDPAQFAQQVILQFRDPDCVASWDDLDQPPTGTEPCCVTLGHVTLTSTTELTATTFFRQGVCPRFNVIRNTDGEPSIYLDQIEFDGTALGLPSVNEPGVGIPVTTLFGPKPVVVNGPAAFFKPTAFLVAGGVALQATHVSPFAAPYKTGAFADGGGGNSRVFAFSGGTADGNGTEQVPAGLAGTSAVPIELASGTIARAGIPLEFLAGDPAAHVVKVQQATPPTSYPDGFKYVGLSAGKSYLQGGKPVVPVAAGGIVRATVAIPPNTTMLRGHPLTIGADPTTLVPASLVAASSSVVFARSCQQVDNSSTTAPLSVGCEVWVVGPPQQLTVP